MTKSKKPSPVADNQVLFRILDANFNRTREGLRILEDLGRFYLRDSHLTEKIKTLRHQLTKYFLELPVDRTGLLMNRQVNRDSGRKLYPKTESRRRGLPEILTVNFKRVQEGLRSLEEFSKPLAARLGERFKVLRFKAYHLEKAIILPLLKSAKKTVKK